MQQDTEHCHQGDAQQHRQHKRQTEGLVSVKDAVHAHHHEFGITDPDHVDHAEDQVQAQRQQGQQTRQQKAVENRFEKEDVE